MISNRENIIFYSSASIWEITIKEALGKLEIPNNFSVVLTHQPFLQLSITVEHAFGVADLPLYHQDPFDRILMAQAKLEKLTFVTKDHQLKKYGVPVLKA